MPITVQQGASPIEGYTLTRVLGRGGFGEVWEATAPGGLLKAIKFIAIDSADPDQHCRELDGLQKIKSIRHPYLLSIERFEVAESFLIVVMEMADKSLADRFEECVEAGLHGIPRDELLRYMREASEILDIMNEHHGLQHLDIKPGNLFLMGGHIKVADFGLVQPRKASLSRASLAISPPYAPPELFDGRVEPTADLYSLAVTYQELLTGSRPYSATDVRGLIFQHLKERADLSLLPSSDRPIVAKAIQRDVSQRFARCIEFVDALQRASAFGVPTEDQGLIRTVPKSSAPTVVTDVSKAAGEGRTIQPRFVPGQAPRPKDRTRPIASKQVRTDQVAAKTDDGQKAKDEFHATFLAFLPPEIFGHKLRGFIEAMQAEIVNLSDDNAVLQFRTKGWFGFYSQSIFMQIETYCRNPTSGYRVVDAAVWSSSPKGGSSQDLLHRAMLLFRYLKAYLMATEAGGIRGAKSEAEIRAEIFG
jgi:serine/threonine protein kinase